MLRYQHREESKQLRKSLPHMQKEKASDSWLTLQCQWFCLPLSILDLITHGRGSIIQGIILLFSFFFTPLSIIHHFLATHFWFILLEKGVNQSTLTEPIMNAVCSNLANFWVDGDSSTLPLSVVLSKHKCLWWTITGNANEGKGAAYIFKYFWKT